MPSDYMREMNYTSQPLEVTDMKLLESTFYAIDAENKLLYSSDWPYWDFDVPGRIMGIPFMSEHGKRNVLGETARSSSGCRDGTGVRAADQLAVEVWESTA